LTFVLRSRHCLGLPELIPELIHELLVRLLIFDPLLEEQLDGLRLFQFLQLELVALKSELFLLKLLHQLHLLELLFSLLLLGGCLFLASQSEGHHFL